MLAVWERFAGSEPHAWELNSKGPQDEDYPTNRAHMGLKKNGTFHNHNTIFKALVLSPNDLVIYDYGVHRSLDASVDCSSRHRHGKAGWTPEQPHLVAELGNGLLHVFASTWFNPEGYSFAWAVIQCPWLSRPSRLTSCCGSKGWRSRRRNSSCGNDTPPYAAWRIRRRWSWWQMPYARSFFLLRFCWMLQWQNARTYLGQTQTSTFRGTWALGLIKWIPRMVKLRRFLPFPRPAGSPNQLRLSHTQIQPRVDVQYSPKVI